MLNPIDIFPNLSGEILNFFEWLVDLKAAWVTSDFVVFSLMTKLKNGCLYVWVFKFHPILEKLAYICFAFHGFQVKPNLTLRYSWLIVSQTIGSVSGDQNTCRKVLGSNLTPGKYV